MSASTPLPMTSEQRAICECADARIVVEANAGSGKTTTAAMKVARLVEAGASPSKVLALSFTSPGAQAFRDAFRRLGVDPAVASAVRVGTFEDFCAARLKRLEGPGVQRLEQPEHVRPFVLQAIAQAREWADERHPGEFTIAGPGDLAVEGLLEEFARIKGTLLLVHEAEHFQLSPAGAAEFGCEFTTLAVYRFYERLRCHPAEADGPRTRLRYAGDATYDMACALLSDDPPFVWDDHPLRLRLEAVVLDEMHDTNRAMFTVLKALLAVNEGARFIGVGDRDQVIHAQEGADPAFMGEAFDRELGAPTRLPLTRSYRFGPEVAKPLGTLARKDYLAQPERASRVDVLRADSAGEVLGIINEAITRRDARRDDSPEGRIAVLLRHPSDACDLEHELRRTGLRYETAGFTTYLQRPEVLFVRLLLMAAVGSQAQLASHLLVDAKRAAWAFVGGTLQADAGVEDTTASVIDSASQENFFQWVLPKLLETTQDASTREQVLAAIDLASADRATGLAASMAALDVGRLARRIFVNVEAAEDAQASIRGLVRAGHAYESISSFLDSLVRHDHDAYARKFANERLILSSIEAAKGLEFDTVIVPDVNRHSFPGESRDDRNRFYVAASRARRQLTLTHRTGQASALLGPYLR